MQNHMMDESKRSVDRAHILVLGNEKGGSGKSTTAMHILMALADRGLRVAAIDLDSRQRSLSRYLENRSQFIAQKGIDLPLPTVLTLQPSDKDLKQAAQEEDKETLSRALAQLSVDCDVVIIDCPGSDSPLSRMAHALADTILTPLNDSFVDLDLLARVDRDRYEVEAPSLYAEMVWEARKRRAMADRGQIDWIVMRNRVATLHARNKQRVETVLAKLSRRVGFRYIPGLSERVIYRELFLKGLTLVDMKKTAGLEVGASLTMSQVSARNELRRVVEALNIPALRKKTEAAE
ncbi:division plane positioning ATPase MipZ [Iodidimonas nitroreducens]|uniref:division plane positioning ATPase MipZ n=1 Tax=Iodidimonas nitroreducens TaxID=1236968 RepID=UPI0028D791E6|nr:division plane positioning ATPase MipZ [Iodidimonas nitroreducens]